jgi:predicted deacylase
MRKLCLLLITAVLVLGGICAVSPVLPAQTPAPSAPATTAAAAASVVDPNQTYSYETLKTDAGELAGQYPGLIEVSGIGKSVEDRDLVLIRLGKGAKRVLLAGAHHAREYITSAFLMETVDEYARAYVTGGKIEGQDIQALLNEVTLYVVPMVNPDGVNLVKNGPDAARDPAKVRSMRMLQSSYSAWKANINGVDLNRQYPCHWEEKASNTDVPSSEMYKGTAPATEPEVKAMIALCEQYEFTLAVSFHTKGEVIYWADSGTEDAIAADAQIAQSIGEVTGYELMPVSEDPAVYGAGFENWFRQEFERPAFCIELTPVGEGVLPYDDSRFDELVWSKAKGLGAVLMRQAAGG